MSWLRFLLLLGIVSAHAARGDIQQDLVDAILERQAFSAQELAVLDLNQDGKVTVEDLVFDNRNIALLNTYSIETSPDGDFKMALGGQLRMLAQIRDAQERLVFNSITSTVIVDWQSADSGVVSVDANGLARATGIGTTTITGTIRGTTQSASATVTVDFSDIANIFMTPARTAVDVGSEIALNISAVDQFGAPTTLNPTATRQLSFESTYVSASYDDTLGQEKVNVTGLQKGFSLLTLDVGGFTTSAVIIEVKPSVIIPNPTPSSNADFGIQPSLALDGPRIHISSYDQTNHKLIYTRFENTWSSITLDGTGDYGQQSQTLVDPLNNNKVLIAAVEGTMISAWTPNDFGFWARYPVDTINNENTPYNGEIKALVDASGRTYLLYYDQANNRLRLATSSTTARDAWETFTVTKGGGRYCDMVLGPDGVPRLAMQFDDKAYYGHLRADNSGVFEEIDTDPGAGTGIRLAIGRDNRPQVVYTKNGNHVHAMKIAGTWFRSVVETVNNGISTDFGLALNFYGEARTSYYDASNRTLRFASRQSDNTWQIDTPISNPNVGQYHDMQVDAFGRAHIVYYDASRREVGYFVEPHFLRYTSTIQTGGEADSNTDAATLLKEIPQDLAVVGTPGNVDLAWSVSAGAETYRVYSNAVSGVSILDPFIEATSTNLSQAVDEIGTFYFGVTAVNGPNESALSEVRGVTFEHTTAMMAAVGYGHTVFVKSDGSLWGTGNNQYGQLGIDTGAGWRILSPRPILTSGVVKVAAGDYFTLFIKDDGSLWAMGLNTKGQLGNGTNEGQPVPVRIVESGVTDVACGGFHSLFVKNDGTVWAMGLNDSGQLGDGSQSDSNIPVEVFDIGAAQVSAGRSHSVFVTEIQRAWGMGEVGSSGHKALPGYPNGSSIPVKFDIANRITRVSAAFDDNTFYISDINGGTLYRAGPSIGSSYGFTSWPYGTARDVSAGRYHVMFITTDGSLWAAGGNTSGQLGDGSKINRPNPVKIVDNGVESISAGTNHSVFIDGNSELWAMGSDGNGALGTGTTESSPTPVHSITIIHH